MDEVQVVTDPHHARVMFDPLRSTLLQLLLQRAASVQELAAAVGRPKSSTAYHVKVLADAGLLKVVATRIVRGKQEHVYGRTARLFAVGDVQIEPSRGVPGFFEAAAADADAALRDDDFRGLTRYAWISPTAADAFWNRVLDLLSEYSRLPSTADGTTAYALLSAIYPTQHPRLPPLIDTHGPDDQSPPGRYR